MFGDEAMFLYNMNGDIIFDDGKKAAAYLAEQESRVK